MMAENGGITMNTALGWFCFVVLAATAAIHVYWALGGLWPADDTPALVRTVIGVERDRMPPAGLTLLVGTLIFLAGCFAFVRGVLDRDSLVLIRIPLAGLAMVFLLRGAVTYLPGGPFAQAAQPFAHLNMVYFSPLILMLGAAFAWLAISPPRG